MLVQSFSSFADGEFELQNLRSLDTQRKSLIKLAIVQAINISNANRAKALLQEVLKAPSRVITPTPTGEPKSAHEYEIIINKLKQDATTKDKVYESKIELLRNEVERLKNQLYQNPLLTAGGMSSMSSSAPLSAGTALFSSQSNSISNTNFSFGGNHGHGHGHGHGLSFSTSPYLNKVARNYLTPTINSLSKSIDSVASPEGLRILPAIENKKKLIQQQQQGQKAKPKRTYTNFNTLKKLNSAEGITSDDIMNGRTLKQLNVPNARRKPGIVTVTTLLSSVASGISTPSKSKNVTSDEEMGSLSSFADDDDEDTFASANSTLSNSVASNGNTAGQKKKKKLKLWKSEATKVSIPKEADASIPSTNNTSPNKGLNLEEEDLNTLNYYQDSNWTEESEFTPKKDQKKRTISDENGTKKRKKNVFKID